jgi:hypothetical protein
MDALELLLRAAAAKAFHRSKGAARTPCFLHPPASALRAESIASLQTTGRRHARTTPTGPQSTRSSGQSPLPCLTSADIRAYFTPNVRIAQPESLRARSTYRGGGSCRRTSELDAGYTPYTGTQLVRHG